MRKPRSRAWPRRIGHTALLVALATIAPQFVLGAPLVNERQDEADLNVRRREWIEDLHRAAPGTDWRALEDANRLEAMFLLQAGASRPAGTGWTERGAANQTGRNFDCALGEDGQLYVGSANGGLFRGPPLGGSSWTALTDNVGYGVEHVVALGGPPVQLVIASNSRIFTSTDAGSTWAVPSGLPSAIWNVVRLVREADNTTTVYALVEGWIWTGSWDHNWHLLRSTNGGVSFSRVYTVPLATRPDMWISRTGAGPLYLAYGSGLYVSVDHGSSFTPVGGPPASGAQIRLAGSEAGAPTFYWASYTSGPGWSLCSSTDGGVNWTTPIGLPDFYGTIMACVTDPQQVFVGGVDCYRSTDGGATLPRINFWYEYYGNPDHKLHADIYGFTSTVGPGGTDERVYIHTDGGTFSLTPATTVPDNFTRFGFQNAQYYGTLTSNTDPDLLFAGSQDQGYQISDPATANSTPDFSQAISGDYAHLVSSWPDRTRMVFSVYPGFVLVQPGPGNAPALEQTTFPAGPHGFKFLPATAPDLSDPAAVYVGGRGIWRVRREGPFSYSWSQLPYDFNHGDGDVVGAIATAPGDLSRRYAATYNGRLYFSTDSGTNWTQSSVAGPPSHYFAGSDLVVSPTDPLVAWVCGSGYSNSAVFRTSDGGVTWTPMSSGLPSTQAYAIALDNATSQTPYLATQAGPFRWNGSAWENLILTSCCAPLTDYWDVESVPSAGLMRFSTYGRGIWDFAVDPPVSVSGPVTPVLSLALSLSPNPASARSTVSFDLPSAGLVQVEVFDVLGRRVRTVADGWRQAGIQAVGFDHRGDDGHALRGGLYVVRLKTSQGVAVQRLAITG